MGWWADKVQGRPPTGAVVPARMYPTPGAPGAQAPAAYPQPGYADPNAEIHVTSAAGIWRGTKAANEGSSRCPECGGPNFMRRKAENARTEAAPACFDCGYPLVQFGSKGGTGGAMQTVRDPSNAGPATHAREPGGIFDGGFQPKTVVARVG